MDAHRARQADRLLLGNLAWIYITVCARSKALLILL